MSIEERLRQFKEDGYVVFEELFPQSLRDRWRAAFPDLSRRSTPPGATEPAWWVGEAMELDPPLFLPLVADEAVLDFLERVIGPFVQLDSVAIVAFPSVPREQAAGKATAWHRDRYAETPQAAEYIHPVACNLITYLQDLTDEVGPLRVVPGSHRRPGAAIATDERTGLRADEVVLNVKAGDAVFTHAQLLHTGTPNVSGQPRFFLSAYYNRSWMRQRDNFDGPGIRALVDAARARGDRRTLRLFGRDDTLWTRVNPYWDSTLEEERWARWIAEDRALLKA